MFPEETPEEILLSNGCGIVLKDGSEIYAEEIPSDKREFVKCIDRVIGGISVTRAKELIRKYGGSGWAEHIDRDGSLFETTEIKLSGNNSRFRYNHHL